MIRVALVLPSRIIPAWLSELRAELDGLNNVGLTVGVLNGHENSYASGDWLYSLWKRFDYLVFKRRNKMSRDGEQIVEIKNYIDVDEDDERIARNVDLIIWAAFSRPSIGILGSPRFGVWGLTNATRRSVGFGELMKGMPVIACQLIRFGQNPADDRALLTAFVASNNLSISASLAVVRARDSGNLLTMIRRFQEYAQESQAITCHAAFPPWSDDIPGPLLLAYGMTRVCGRYVGDLAQRLFHFKQWQLAIRFGGDRLDPNNLVRVKPDHRGFWADPFIVHREGRTAVFFEEMPAVGNRGHIKYFEIGKNGRLGKVRTALKRDYHLSYPFMFEFEGELFMTPECADRGRVEAFRCVRYPDRWEHHATLMDGLRAFDPTLIEHDGRWWMFATVQKNGNSPNDELHLFHASSPFADWTPHPLNPINVDVRTARPGGALFMEEGELYRPAQDCSIRYGYAISINKILRMTVDEYEEVEVRRIVPDSADEFGTHTLNQAAGITIYDCFVKRPFGGDRA